MSDVQSSEVPATGTPLPSSVEGQMTSGNITRVESVPVSRQVSDASMMAKIAENARAAQEPAAQEAQEAERIESKPSSPPPSLPEEEKADKWANQFEKLTKRDAEIRAKELSFKEKEQKLRQLEEVQEIARTKGKIAALQALGMSVDDILKESLNNGRPDPNDEIKALREDIKALKAESTLGIGRIEMNRKAEKWDEEFERLIKNDEYEIIRSWDGAKDHIVQNVIMHHQQTGEFLPPKEQLDTLARELKNRFEKLGYTRVLKNEKSTPTEAKVTKPQESPKENRSGPKTLTPKIGAASGQVRSFIDDEDAEMARIVARYS